MLVTCSIESYLIEYALLGKCTNAWPGIEGKSLHVCAQVHVWGISACIFNKAFYRNECRAARKIWMHLFFWKTGCIEESHTHSCISNQESYSLEFFFKLICFYCREWCQIDAEILNSSCFYFSYPSQMICLYMNCCKGEDRRISPLLLSLVA